MRETWELCSYKYSMKFMLELILVWEEQTNYSWWSARLRKSSSKANNNYWIMFTVGSVNRYIDRYIGRHSIDVAVTSRSTVDRVSIDTPLTVNRLAIDCWLSVDRQSTGSQSTVDRVVVDIAVDAIEYPSYVGRISANCQRYVGQLSVAYRSTVGCISVNCWWHISRMLIWMISYVRSEMCFKSRDRQ